MKLEAIVPRPKGVVEILKRYLYVTSGAERFELRTSDAPAIRRLLADAARRPDARAEMKDVLRLMVALETRLGSPTAAARLRAALKATPECHPLVRSLGFASASGLDATRRFLSREGRQAAPRAPRHDAAAPQGTVPLRDLLKAPSVTTPRPRRS